MPLTTTFLPPFLPRHRSTIISVPYLAPSRLPRPICRRFSLPRPQFPHIPYHRHCSSPPTASAEVTADPTVLSGVTEALEFLAATTLVIPIFRRLKLSPILGFLLAGVFLGPHGLRLVKDVDDIREIADFGVLFLLFEMGLELSLDRLRKLRKYAFGMGLLQVSVTAIVLGLGARAMGGGLAESAVVGSALSLSSSAFILQILAEKGERQSRAGVATFGILLFQDIAVVPLLILVPLLGSAGVFNPANIGDDIFIVVKEGVKHIVAVLGTLNFVVLVGGTVLKKVFTIVAESKSSEAFTSLALLTVLGTALLAQEFGLSMTMGSFLAGVLLAESSFRSRVKIDLEPFRGLLLGLFFITTGMSLDLSLFLKEPLQVAFLMGSLVFWKTLVCTIVGLPFGLSLAESVRIGLLIGQGGEFAFVLFALANKLGFLPDDVNSFLITTVVATMALTPVLYEAGKFIAPRIDAVVGSKGGTVTAEAAIQEVSEENFNFVLIFGFGPVGRVVGRMLSRKFIRWVAVELDNKRVEKAKISNLPVVYGDSQRPAEFLEANGLPKPEAFVITHSQDELVEDVLSAVRSAFPDRPVYVRAKNLRQQKDFLRRGATAMYPEVFETSLQLGQSVLEGFSTSREDIKSIKAEVRGDAGLSGIFERYDEWFKKNMRQPGGEENGDTEERAEYMEKARLAEKQNKHAKVRALKERVLSLEMDAFDDEGEIMEKASSDIEDEDEIRWSENTKRADPKSTKSPAKGNGVDT